MLLKLYNYLTIWNTCCLCRNTRRTKLLGWLTLLPPWKAGREKPSWKYWKRSNRPSVHKQGFQSHTNSHIDLSLLLNILYLFSLFFWLFNALCIFGEIFWLPVLFFRVDLKVVYLPVSRFVIYGLPIMGTSNVILNHKILKQ